jgi:undecaprenyl diphosphate synthase
MMDGNGRWAAARGFPRTAGHEAGVKSMHRAVKAAVEQGIATLTLYAFSSNNWQRPKSEVKALMELFRRDLRKEIKQLIRAGIRLSVIGRRDRLPTDLVTAIKHAEGATFSGKRLHLRIAIDYSARDAILAAAARLDGADGLTHEDFGRLVTGEADLCNVDLVIRTGGEKRLSDFLLWECAYAELYFTTCYWPDFSEDDFAAALADFRERDRRFGGLNTSNASAAA